MADDAIKSVTLCNGIVATVRRPRGRDLIAADRIVPERAKNPSRWQYAMLAQVITINGNRITAEDVAEMYLVDLDAIAMALGEDFLSQASMTSSSSSSAASDLLS